MEAGPYSPSSSAPCPEDVGCMNYNIFANKRDYVRHACVGFFSVNCTEVYRSLHLRLIWLGSGNESFYVSTTCVEVNRLFWAFGPVASRHDPVYERCWGVCTLLGPSSVQLVSLALLERRFKYQYRMKDISTALSILGTFRKSSGCPCQALYTYGQGLSTS